MVWIEFKASPVVGQKEAACNPGRALVTVCKGVASCKAPNICRRQVRDVGLAMGVEICRARQSAFQGVTVLQAVGATMLCDLAVVNGENGPFRYPAPRIARRFDHLANARSTSRSSCMISSANFICRSKSGS